MERLWPILFNAITSCAFLVGQNSPKVLILYVVFCDDSFCDSILHDGGILW